MLSSLMLAGLMFNIVDNEKCKTLAMLYQRKYETIRELKESKNFDKEMLKELMVRLLIIKKSLVTQGCLVKKES